MNIPSVSMPHGRECQCTPCRICKIGNYACDGNGTNIERLLNTSGIAGNSDTDVIFTAKVYDANGTDACQQANGNGTLFTILVIRTPVNLHR